MKRSELPKDDPRYQPMYVGWSWKRNERLKSKIMKKNNWFQPGTDPRTDIGNQPSGTGRKTGMMGGHDAQVEL